jgi:hypothetical protein
MNHSITICCFIELLKVNNKEDYQKKPIEKRNKSYHSALLFYLSYWLIPKTKKSPKPLPQSFLHKTPPWKNFKVQFLSNHHLTKKSIKINQVIIT